MKQSPEELIEAIRAALKFSGHVTDDWSVNIENRGDFILAEIRVELLIPRDKKGGESA